VCADDVRLHGFAPEPMDKRAARAFYEEMFAAFPENRLELHETFGSGNRLSTRFTLTGRHDGNFMGVPATGAHVALAGVTIMHFRDDTCASSAGRAPTTWAPSSRSELSGRPPDRTPARRCGPGRTTTDRTGPRRHNVTLANTSAATARKRRAPLFAWSVEPPAALARPTSCRLGYHPAYDSVARDP
jgi:hypothetical protein